MASSFFRPASFGAVAIALLCSVGSPAIAAERGEVFKPRNFDEKSIRPHFSKSRRIDMDETALARPMIELDIFGDSVTAVRDKIEQHADGSLSWIGHVSGSKADRVILTGRRGAFVGRIDHDGAVYEVSRAADGVMKISKFDPTTLPEEEPFHLPHSPDGGPSFAAGKPGVPTTALATAAAPVQQDILVAYTDDACRNAGGDGASDCDQVEARIVNAVSDMNAAYAASDVNITMNLVGMVLTDYDESGKSASEMLSELRQTSDGQMDELHDARNTYGADLLALVTGTGGGFCGIAYVSASSSYAMSVTAESCLLNRTLAHEVGHNQGSSHARSQNDGGVSGAYNYGYRRCNDGSVDDVGAPFFSTIMAYGCSGAARIGAFSNPQINYNGAPIGIDPAVDPDNGAWAARTLNESASQIANFRASTTPPDPTDPPLTTTPPAAPSNLVASVLGGAEISLSWNDNANNESQFQLQRAIGGGSFSTIATLVSNSTSFGDDGLTQGTTYRYRVRASNSDGASAYSNTAQATTTSTPTATDDKALGDVAQAEGRVIGGYANTHFDDGITQRLVEESVGARSRTHQYRGAHVWRFDIMGGGNVTFEANAYVSGREGFRFDYRRAGERAWRQMFVVDSNSTSNIERYTFPNSVSGVIYVRARDAYLGKNEVEDTLTVDYMAATTNPSGDQSTTRAVTPLVYTPPTNEPTKLRTVFRARKELTGYVPLDLEVASAPQAAQQPQVLNLPVAAHDEYVWRARYSNFRSRLRD